MHAYDLLINNGTDGQAVKDVTKLLPKLDVVATLALVVKTVDSCDRRTLMVATEQEKVQRELGLVSEKQSNDFQALLTPIHIITQEKVVAFRGEAAIFEQTQKVMVLTMNISTDLERRLEFKQRWLLQKYVTHGGAERLQLSFGNLYHLSWLLAKRLEALVNDHVHVKFEVGILHRLIRR
jgi:hypothetical protein